MNFEQNFGLEKTKSGREKLLELERQGSFVFHGSSEIINTLEPKQAYNFNEETGEDEKDGDPAVFATPYADMAIFRALVNGRGLEEDSDTKFGINEDGSLNLCTTKNLLEKAKGLTARVYVLGKDDFEEFDYIQCRAKNKIIPKKIIEVNISDLPDNIKIID